MQLIRKITITPETPALEISLAFITRISTADKLWEDRMGKTQDTFAQLEYKCDIFFPFIFLL